MGSVEPSGRLNWREGKRAWKLSSCTRMPAWLESVIRGERETGADKDADDAAAGGRMVVGGEKGDE